MNMFPLSELSIGKTCVLKEINLFGSLQRRLWEMGFQKGEAVTCVFVAPSGSPIAFQVKGAIVALRRGDCEQIGAIESA